MALLGKDPIGAELGTRRDAVHARWLKLVLVLSRTVRARIAPDMPQYTVAGHLIADIGPQRPGTRAQLETSLASEHPVAARQPTDVLVAGSVPADRASPRPWVLGPADPDFDDLARRQTHAALTDPRLARRFHERVAHDLNVDYDEMVRALGYVWDCRCDDSANVTGFACAVCGRTRAGASG
jgi:hypothetical protein